MFIKYSFGSSLIGGRHIKPIISKANSILQNFTKLLRSLIWIPDFCFSFPILKELPKHSLFVVVNAKTFAYTTLSTNVKSLE